MTITLHPDQERAIEEAIRVGAFRSVDEFIDAAIAILPGTSIGEDPASPARKSRLGELRQDLKLGDTTIRELIEEGRE